MSDEYKRKIFHITALVFPILYLLLSKESIIFLLLILCSLSILIDLARTKNKFVKEVIAKFFSPIMKPEEISGKTIFSGASYMAGGFLLTAYFYPKDIAIISWFILIFSDSLAAVIGKKYGHTIFAGKSLIGLLTFFTTSMIIIFIAKFFIPINLRSASLAVVFTSLIEFMGYFIKIDDNFTVPVSFCIFYTIL